MKSDFQFVKKLPNGFVEVNFEESLTPNNKWVRKIDTIKEVSCHPFEDTWIVRAVVEDLNWLLTVAFDTQEKAEKLHSELTQIITKKERNF